MAKVGFQECLRHRILYFIFITAALFIIAGKACNPGDIRGNDLFFDRQARQNLASAVAFHGIALWSLMLSGLLSAGMLSREIEGGAAALVLSRPVSRAAMAAGKLIAVLSIAALNMVLLCSLFAVLYYLETGMMPWRIYLGCALMAAGLVLFSQIGLLASLLVSRMLAPLVCLAVYAASMWSALPFYFEKLRFIWAPSETIVFLHRFLPRFGDLQFGGASLIHAGTARPELYPALISTLLYCAVLWCLTMALLQARDMA